MGGPLTLSMFAKGGVCLKRLSGFLLHPSSCHLRLLVVSDKKRGNRLHFSSGPACRGNAMFLRASAKAASRYGKGAGGGN